MFSIKPLPEFTTWLDGLKDRMVAQRLNLRLRKALLGGGEKSTQATDISKAAKHVATLEE